MSARNLNHSLADTGELDRGAHAWRWAGGAIALGVLAVLAIFWETAWSLVFTWWNSPAYSHGLLVPPISAYLIWKQRARLAGVCPRPSILGLGATVAAALIWLIGEVATVQLFQQLAMIALLQGLVLSVIGLRATAIIAFPLLYLFFGVPFGTFLIAPLQDMTAAFIVHVLQLIGMPVYIDGIFIHIPSGSFEVAEACAGLRFLISSIALGAIFAYEFYRQLWRRALFMTLTVIVPIIANGFRATGIVLLAHYSDYQIAVAADHITYGLIFLSLVLFCLLAIGYSFREPYREITANVPAGVQEGTPVSSPFRFPAAAAIAVLIAATSWTFAARIAGTDARSTVSLTLPDAGPWHSLDRIQTDWRPSFHNASQEILRSYGDGSRQVDVYLAYFTHQRRDAEIVNWKNSLIKPEPWARAGGGSVDVQVAGQTIAANYERILAHNRERTIWYWYLVDGRLTNSPLLAKLLEAKAKLFGGEQAAAIIALAVDSTLDPKGAHAALSDFLAQAWPLTQIIVAQ